MCGINCRLLYFNFIRIVEKTIKYKFLIESLILKFDRAINIIQLMIQ